MSLFDGFRTNLQSKKLIPKNKRVLVAVSGGLDSVALLHLLHRIRNELELSLSVVHIHHGIRGSEADSDVDFVSSLAVYYHIPFFIDKVNAPEFAKNNKLSLEEAARDLRYEAFEKMLRMTQSDLCATAHTGNDQAETMLDRFLRGSGIAGFQGIPERRGPFVRPLLVFQRAEIEAYVRDEGLKYRVDSSNQDMRFRRNRIRHQLIPQLLDYNPGLVTTLMKTSHIFREQELFLRAQTEAALNSLVSLHKKNEIILEIDAFLKYFNILRKYILMEACERLSIHRKHLTFHILERALKLIENRKIGKKLSLAADYELSIDYDGIIIKRRQPKPDPIVLELLENHSCRYQDFLLSWRIIKKPENLRFEDSKQVEFVDVDKVGTRLYVRMSLPGDKLEPLNFKGHKKVADYFSDRKVPHHTREVTPIIESSHGIVWVCGHIIDDKFKVTDATKTVLRLELRECLDES
ncbi:MAG: tRNA lysidine(34) synthetase TilS [bacterium]